MSPQDLLHTDPTLPQVASGLQEVTSSAFHLDPGMEIADPQASQEETRLRLAVAARVTWLSLGKRLWCAPPWPTCRGHPHCCLQADSLRILLLVEQALRAGLEAPLDLRSALDLVLSWAGSVPFTHMALGRPRLCPFWPASSSETCPRRGRASVG